MVWLTDTDGKTYNTQDEVGKGGEGAILTVQGRKDVVVKHYFAGQATPEREAKLRAMLADPPRDEMHERFNHASITWPLALLSDGGRFAGYLMPRIHGGVPLVNAYNPCAKDFLRLDWRARHQVASNLCTALHALHVKGYVMGDINPLNVLVTARGFVTLVDTDSFQVCSGNTVHRCPVGVPEYTPRELQGQRFDQVDRAPEHDRFGLAVLVFHLLMDGHHPFAGALKDPKDSVPDKADVWRIKSGFFPWLPTARFCKPPAARPLETLDPRLYELFVRCFLSGHVQPILRPSPKDWLDALDAAQQRLVSCSCGAWRYPNTGDCHVCQSLAIRPAVIQRQAARQAPTPPWAVVAVPPAPRPPPPPVRPIPAKPARAIPTRGAATRRWTVWPTLILALALSIVLIAVLFYGIPWAHRNNPDAKLSTVKKQLLAPIPPPPKPIDTVVTVVHREPEAAAPMPLPIEPSVEVATKPQSPSVEQPPPQDSTAAPLIIQAKQAFAHGDYSAAKTALASAAVYAPKLAAEAAQDWASMFRKSANKAQDEGNRIRFTFALRNAKECDEMARKFLVAPKADADPQPIDSEAKPKAPDRP